MNIYELFKQMGISEIPVDLGEEYDFEGRYHVTLDGEIVSEITGMKLLPSPTRKIRKDGTGHAPYTIWKVKLYDVQKIKCTRSVGRIVLESYTRYVLKEILGMEEKVIDFSYLTVDHINYDTNDNSLKNLRWLTRAENIRNKRDNSKFWNIEELREYCRLYFMEKWSLNKICRTHKRSEQIISNLLRGVTHDGFAKKYCEEKKLDFYALTKSFREKDYKRINEKR